jgi:PQQ-dependent catabolism-associated CXXCW motif protein
LKRWRNGRFGRGLAALALFALGSFAVAAMPDPPAEPPGYRQHDYRSATPLTLEGAKVVTSEEAMPLWRSGAALFIDVMPMVRKPANLPASVIWRQPEHRNIPRSVWLPDSGHGTLNPEAAESFRAALERLTGGDSSSALLFYCLRDCWMSWNAAKRALALGYRDVTWYPDGTDGWTELGGDLIAASPFEGSER